MDFYTRMKEIARTQLKLILGKGVFYSYAQNGEDAVINLFTKKVKKGFFIDVGGFHPIQYSNTYALYKRGWRGIVVEPNPRAASLFSFFRPKDILVKAGVGLQAGNLTYHSFQDPAYNTFDASQAQEWQNKGAKLKSTSSVPVIPLRDIVREQKVQKIDVLSVDVEGMDLEVLQSHDWNVLPTIIVVESHEFNVTSPQKSPVYAFLTSKGYELSSLVGFSLVFRGSK